MCPIFYCWLHLSAAVCLILSWIVSVLFFSIPVYYFVKWRRDTTARNVARKMAAAEEENKKVEMVEMNVQKTDGEEEKKINNSNNNNNNNNGNNGNNSNSDINANDSYVEEDVVAPSSVIPDNDLVAKSSSSANVIFTDAGEKSVVLDAP